MADPLYFATPALFRAWLKRHHGDASELLVGYHKVGSGQASITWPESVDEALCVGWIDGVREAWARTPTRSASPRVGPAAAGAR